MQAHKLLLQQVWPMLKEKLLLGQRLVIEVKTEKRSDPQNAALHAALRDISEQVEWHGKKLSVDIWRRLCMAAWLRERNKSPMLIPALDGNGFDIIYEHTSELSKAEFSELIEWCFAFGAEQGVKFLARDDWGDNGKIKNN